MARQISLLIKTAPNY